MKLTALIVALAFVGPVAAQERPPEMSRDEPEQVALQEENNDLKAQVMLDRAHFSVGEIDGNVGSTSRAAIKHFQKERGIPETGELDANTMGMLDDGQPILREHTLTEEEVGGNFGARPLYKDKMEKLGELFQSSPKLLQKLNPNASFSAGERIQVPAVGSSIGGTIDKIVVDVSDKSLIVYDASGKLLAYYPTTLGNDESIPYGEHTVKAIAKNPHYRRVVPDTGEVREMKGGPNNFVGNMWMALSVKHYGIHGSPEPDKIAKQQSAGCIRLTNWDANEVAAAITKNVKVVVQE